MCLGNDASKGHHTTRLVDISTLSQNGELDLSANFQKISLKDTLSLFTAAETPSSYEVVKLIGDNTDEFLQIFEAKKDGQPVCVKATTTAASAQARAVLKREHENLDKLRHRHVLEAVDLIENDEVCAVVTELMDMDLYELFDEAFDEIDSVSTEVVRIICRQLVSIVNSLHEEFGMAHLDIKPENFLVKFPEGTHPSGRPWEAKDYYDAEHTLKFRIVLGDLGFANRSRENGELICYKGVLGSPGYMAPEIERREEFMAESVDIFALARTLFTIIIGFPPWEGAGDPFFEAWKVGNYAEYWEAMSHHCTTWDLDEDFVDMMTGMMSFGRKRPSCRQVLAHPFLNE